MPSPAVTFASFTGSVFTPTIGASIAGAPWFAGPLLSFAVAVLWVTFYPTVVRRIARADGCAEVERIAARRAAAERLGVPLEELPPAASAPP